MISTLAGHPPPSQLRPFYGCKKHKPGNGEWTLEQLQLWVFFLNNNFVLLSVVLEALFWANLVCFLL
jgi:hypothetical protein